MATQSSIIVPSSTRNRNSARIGAFRNGFFFAAFGKVVVILWFVFSWNHISRYKQRSNYLSDHDLDVAPWKDPTVSAKSYATTG